MSKFFSPCHILHVACFIQGWVIGIFFVYFVFPNNAYIYGVFFFFLNLVLFLVETREILKGRKE